LQSVTPAPISFALSHNSSALINVGWFARQGFSGGKFGGMLKMAYEIEVND